MAKQRANAALYIKYKLFRLNAFTLNARFLILHGSFFHGTGMLKFRSRVPTSSYHICCDWCREGQRRLRCVD